MRVLLVGGGGREHAIAEAIKRSGKKPELYAAMSRKNPGIAKLCEDFVLVKETEVPAIVDYGIRKKIELAFIGPEGPLASSLADALEDIGIPTVGPRKMAAKIEFDKAWAREFMKKYDIGGLPVFKVFDKDSADVGAFIERLGNVAVKPSGLTGGKGVRIMGDHFRNTGEAEAYAKEVLKSDRVVVEERLLGEEFTVQAFVDGESLAYASAVQDHKRAYEGDLGPNTGGMGSYNDSKNILPFMEPADYEDAKKIMQETVLAIKRETGIPYKGILYGQFMLTAKGIKVLEFNARFGDPEAMNVLPLLKTDFLEIAKAIVEGRLSDLEVEFARLATVCKYAVPAGYPENPAKDTLVEVGDIGDALLYYSSVYEKDGQVYTTGSRAIAVVGIAETIPKAERKAEAALLKIKGNLQSRHDIGTSQLIQKRIDHMREIRVYPTKSSL